MAGKVSTLPRKTMVSFVIPVPRLSDSRQSIAEYFRSRIFEHNAVQAELAKIRARHAPLYIAELRFRREGDFIHGLVKTNGEQFQFTRWYEFLNTALGFFETMGGADKVAQISEFKNQMRVLTGDAVINFDVPSSLRTPLNKRLLDMQTDVGEPAAKQLCLSGAGGSYRSVETKVEGSQTKMLHQTMLTGSQLPKQPIPSEGAPTPTPCPDASGHLHLFMTNPDSVVKMCEVLIERVYKSPPVIDVIPEESRQNEHKRKKKAWGLAPLVMRAIARFLPPFTSLSQAWAELSGKIPAGQSVELTALNQCFHPTSWQGCFALFMTPYPMDFTYGVGPEVERRACFLELWRRALNLEGALAKLGGYVDKLLECVIATSSSVRGQTPPRLSSVPPKIIGNLRALLLAGAGQHGSGRSFWCGNESRQEYLKALPECGDPKIVDRIEWLKGNRDAAFEVLYPNVDELSLLPSLALVFSLREPLSHLNENECRKQVLKIMKGERESRVKLYSDCLGWLQKYGGELTR